MAETPIRFAKGSAVWCQTTPVNYHDAVVLEDCVEGDAEAVVRYTDQQPAATQRSAFLWLFSERLVAAPLIQPAPQPRLPQRANAAAREP